MPTFSQFKTALTQAENNANIQNRPFYVITQRAGYRVSCIPHPSHSHFKTLQVLPSNY